MKKTRKKLIKAKHKDTGVEFYYLIYDNLAQGVEYDEKKAKEWLNKK